MSLREQIILKHKGKNKPREKPKRKNSEVAERIIKVKKFESEEMWHYDRYKSNWG